MDRTTRFAEIRTTVESKRSRGEGPRAVRKKKAVTVCVQKKMFEKQEFCEMKRKHRK